MTGTHSNQCLPLDNELQHCVSRQPTCENITTSDRREPLNVLSLLQCRAIRKKSCHILHWNKCRNRINCGVYKILFAHVLFLFMMLPEDWLQTHCRKLNFMMYWRAVFKIQKDGLKNAQGGIDTRSLNQDEQIYYGKPLGVTNVQS